MTPEEHLRQRLEYHLPDEQGQEELIALLLPLLAMGARHSVATWQGLREEVAQAVVLALKDDAERHWRIAWEGSLERANQILAVGEARADLAVQALGTMAKADALKLAMGRLEEVWELLDHAGRLYRMSDLPENEREIGWARTRIGRVYICAEVGKIEQGFAEAEQAQEILERAEVWGRLLMLYVCWARSLDILKTPHKSLNLYKRALGIAELLGREGESYLPMLYNNLATAQRDLGEVEEALDNFERSNDILNRRGEFGAAAVTQLNITGIYLDWGQYGRALRLLQTIEPILQQSHPRAWLIAERHLLRCYMVFNRVHEIRTLSQKLLAVSGMSNSDYLQLFLSLIQYETNSGNLRSAKAWLLQMEHHNHSMQESAWNMLIRLKHAEISIQENNFDFALAEGNHIADYWIQHGSPHQAIDGYLIGAKAALGKLDSHQAFNLGQRAIQLAKQEHKLPHLYRAYLASGDALTIRGEIWRAKRHFQAAISTSNRIQLELSYTLHADVMTSYQESLHRLIALELQRRQSRAAFEALEHSKGRLFLQYLQQSNRIRWQKNDKTIPLLEELADLRRKLFALKQGNHTDPHISEAKLQSRICVIVENLFLWATEDHSSKTYLPNFKKLTQELPDGSALLEYYNDGNYWGCFVVRDGEIEWLPLNVSCERITLILAKIDENQRFTLNYLSANDKDMFLQAKKIRQLYRELGDLLISPILSLIRDINQLFIVPFGDLHRLAFNLLICKNSYLIENYEIVILPTASTMIAPKEVRSISKTFKWLGYSRNGNLPFAVEEAKTLHQRWGGDLYVDEYATSSVLTNANAQILHLSTHAQHRVDHHFDLSYLELHDEDIYEDDILQRELAYELVTLSACETGKVTVAPGEELIGMGRAFLFAGARALVATLWQVEQSVTLQIVNSFYQELLNGASKSGALQKAQVTFYEMHPTTHPVFWGAFQLIGNPSPIGGNKP